MNIGDEFLVSGPTFYEKAHIIEKKKYRDKKVYLLSNNIMLSRRGEPINSKFTIEPYSKDREEYLRNLHLLPKKLRKLESVTIVTLIKLDEKDMKILNKKINIIFSILGLHY